MRTLSAKPGKGQEQPRGLADDVRLLWTIVRMGWDYLVGEGRTVRKRFHARQQSGEKYFVDEVE